jgi:hypothetical protein
MQQLVAGETLMEEFGLQDIGKRIQVLSYKSEQPQH